MLYCSPQHRLIPPFARWAVNTLNSLLLPLHSGPLLLSVGTQVSTVLRMGKNAPREVSSRAPSIAFAAKPKPLDQTVQSSPVIPFAAKDNRAHELSRKKVRRTTEVAKLRAAKRDKRRRCSCCDEKRDKGQTKDGNRKSTLSPCEGDIDDPEWPSESSESTAGRGTVANTHFSLSQVQKVSLLDLLSNGSTHHKPCKKMASEFEIIPSLPPVIVLDDFSEDDLQDSETWEDISGDIEQPDKLALPFSYAQMAAMSK